MLGESGFRDKGFRGNGCVESVEYINSSRPIYMKNTLYIRCEVFGQHYS
jgi:hypothetical protein